MPNSWFRTRTIPTHQYIPVCLLFIGLIVVSLIALPGCSDPPTGGGGGNAGLEVIPSSVVDGERGVSTYPTLDWTIPRLAEVAYPSLPPTFDVYIGRGSTPPLVASGLTEMHYHAGPLEEGAQYHWRVVTHFDGEKHSSPVWSFRTAEEFRYPLTHGNSWVYNVTTTFGSEPEMMTYSVIARNTVDCPEPCNLVSLILSQGGPLPEPPYSTYLQADSGLFVTHAKVGGSVILPKRAAPDGVIRWRGREFASVSELAALFSDMPPRSANVTSAAEVNIMAVLRYPLEEGSRWEFNSPEQGGAFTIVKEVMAKDVQTVTPAGTFPCFEILWRYDLDNDDTFEPDIRVVDYVGPVGLVRRDIRFEGLYRYDEFGNIICRCTYESVQDLTEFELH